MGPSLTLTDPVNSSPSTEFSVAPGKHGAIPARSLNVAHVSSTDAGTSNWWVSSTGSSSGRGRQHRAGGEHAREVSTVLSVSVRVGRRVRSFTRRRSCTRDPVLLDGTPGKGLLDTRRTDRRRAHVRQADTRLGDDTVLHADRGPAGHDGPLLCHPSELLVRRPPARVLRYAYVGASRVLIDSGGEEVDEELVRRHGPGAVRSGDDELCVER